MTDEYGCPFAGGEPALEQVCRRARDADRDKGVGWLRRLWRELRGDYDCPQAGRVPCEIFDGRVSASSFTNWRKFNGR